MTHLACVISLLRVKTISGRRFKGWFDHGRALRTSERVYETCIFDGCGLSITKNPAKIARISRCMMRSCEVVATFVGPASFEECVVEDLKTNGLFALFGTLFSKVVIRGRSGEMKLNREAHLVDHKTNATFDAIRRSHYEAVDWALDLREAKPTLLELSGIPARAILRDPDSQLVVTRERALNTKWRKKISPTNELWPSMIDAFLEGADEDLVLVGPTGHAKKATRDKRMHELLELKKAGVAV